MPDAVRALPGEHGVNVHALAEALRAVAAALEAPEEAATAPQPGKPRKRPRVTPLVVCEDRPVDQLAAKRAAKALGRYRR